MHRRDTSALVWGVYPVDSSWNPWSLVTGDLRADLLGSAMGIGPVVDSAKLSFDADDDKSHRAR